MRKPPMKSDGRFMDTQQVADYLGIHEKQVYTLIHDRGLPATKITGKWLFPRHLVDRWLESSIVNTPGAASFLQEERNLLLIAGSDDPLFQDLINLYRRKEPGTITLLSRAGSGEGLLALRKGLVHVACVHLMDPDGSYSTEHLRELLGRDIVIVSFSIRTQGLFLPPGNPSGVKDLSDALGRTMRWAIREVGTGTRALLDREIDIHDVEPGVLHKGAVPTSSHLETALAVLMDKADIGLGIEAAAGMTGCSFIPVRQERFDLIIRKENYFMEQVQGLLGLVRDEAFHDLAASFKGYDITDSGRIVGE
jgi:putative molybdopterin biosynthesis protein